MKNTIKVFAVGTAAIAVVGILGVIVLARHGFSARDEPWAIEAFAARRLRILAVPAEARDAVNPISPSADVMASARAHFADHCAICHANDGSGDTAIGRNLYPPAPDMREPRTQSLSDGELFYVIHNGIRFTGMPAFGSGDPDEDLESWQLVHFIRHLLTISAEELQEMEKLNPKGAHERAEEEAIENFLSGGSPPSQSSDHRSHEH